MGFPSGVVKERRREASSSEELIAGSVFTVCVLLTATRKDPK
jgi:hypothetical protein